MLAATAAGLPGEFDVRNLMTPWTFDASTVGTPVLLWYGELDSVVGTSVGAVLAR